MKQKFLETKERWLNLNEKEMDQLQKLRLGAEGEARFAACLEAVGFDEGNCRALMDWRLRSEEATETQIDALLLLPGYLILVNIKNYHYNNQGAKSDRISARIKKQLADSKEKLWWILDEEGIRWPIKTALIFVNPEVEEFYLSEVGDDPDFVIQAADYELQLRYWKHQASKAAPCRYDWLIQRLKKYVVNDAFPWYLEAVPADYLLANCYQGMPCMTCGLGLKPLTQRFLVCSAGHRTDQQTYIRQVVEDYLFLTNQETFSRVEIQQMIPQISPRTLNHCFSRYYEMIGQNRGTRYRKNR